MMPEPSTLNFFSLPEELLRKELFPLLNLKGPYVKILDDEPTLTEKGLVTAVADNDSKTPLIEVYHLIIDDDGGAKKSYRIGFCRKSPADASLAYCIEPLDEQSPLYRLISEDSDLLLNPTTRDRLVIKYLEQEVKKKGGLIAHRERNRSRLARVCRAAKLYVNPLNPLDGYDPIKREALNDLLHFVAYGEQDEAERILKVFPEFLLSSATSQVTDCTQARIFESTTAFQLALWNGDWHMYNMMLRYIPEDQQKGYAADLLDQLIVLNENGLRYTVDNLKTCGLRVLDAQSTPALKEAVKNGDAYLFIINNEKDACAIGFRDHTTGEYKEYELEAGNALKEHAKDLSNAFEARTSDHPHYITRDHKILSLAKTEIEKQGGSSTTISATTSEHDLNPLLNASQVYCDNDHNWTIPRRVEHWCVTVGRFQRLLPANVWQWWMDPKLAWKIPEKDFKSDNRSPDAKTLENYFVLPVSCALGAAYSYVREGRALGHPRSTRRRPGGGMVSFLQFYLSSKEFRAKQLKQQLAYHVDADAKRSAPCSVM